MNTINDQIDFNFSRKLDIQKNILIEKAGNFLRKVLISKKKKPCF